MSLKFGILKETAQNQDLRAPFSPRNIQLLKERYSQAQFMVESASNRVFSDTDYQQLDIDVVTSIADCDILIGMNPIPSSDLIPNKEYLFVTEVVKADTPLITLDSLLGLVGTYNAFRAFGLKFELFKLPFISSFSDEQAVTASLKRPVLPPLKIMVVGTDELILGVDVIMKAMKIKKVALEDYLSKTFAQAVYTFIDNTTNADIASLSKVSDIGIINSPGNGEAINLPQSVLNAKDCKFRVIADLNPNSSNSIACTVRQTTFSEPFYGYLPNEGIEVDLFHPAAIVVTASPDVSAEFPRATSELIGNQLTQLYIPTFFK